MQLSKKARRRGIVFFVLLIIIIGVLVWLFYSQRNNIAAVRVAMTMDETQQEQLQQENDKLFSEISSQLVQAGTNIFSEEEIQKIEKGEMTEKEVIKIIAERQEEIKKEEDKGSGGTSYEANGNVGTLIARLYTLRSSYVGRLDAVVASAKADYATGAYTKSQIVGKYMGKMASLEGACDGQVNGILAQIEAELKKTGGDLSLVSKIRAAYNNEKSIKKGQILSQYK